MISDVIEKARELHSQDNYEAIYELLTQADTQDVYGAQLAELHYLMGVSLDGMGQGNQAQRYFMLALDGCSGSKKLLYELHLSLSGNHYSLGNMDEALKHAHIAKDISESSDQYAMAAETIGRVFLDQRDMREAESWLLASLKSWGRLSHLAVDDYQWLGWIAEDNQDWFLAFRRYSLARLLCRRSTTVSLDEMKSSQAEMLRRLVSRHWPIALIFWSSSSLLVFLTTEALGWSWLVRVAATLAVPTLAGLIAILISILVIE